MPAWNELLDELNKQRNANDAVQWMQNRLREALAKIGELRGGRNVIFYASGFLQKPQLPPPLVSIAHEDINGLMSVMYGMDWAKGLVLVLHTPGGITNAAETVVEYLHSKFDDIEVIVPTFAMSAGTMISLASNRIVMGRQSQLGPIDPQMPLPGRYCSARAVVDQFERAREEILADQRLAHVWAHVLQSMGPSLVQEATQNLEYGEKMVTRWLERRMFANRPEGQRQEMASRAAKHFNDATMHKSHGRRIDRQEAKQLDLDIADLEDDSELQDTVLTAYHVMTITFEKSNAAKMMASGHGRQWVRNV